MSILYGDDPLTADHEDSFGREKIVGRIVSSLNVVRHRTPSAVAALVGPWGSGKTTLLNQVEAALATSGEWQVAKYNPWSYSSLESAIPAFFSEIRAALPENTKDSGAREAIGGWISRLAPLGSFGSLVGADMSGPVQLFADLVTGDRSPENLRSQAEELLRGLGTPILMLIDDLDRLGPDELLMTFKLVRLLGRLPNVYYLLSYDEKTLQDVLMRTGLVANEKSRAREYMEKMIQLRLDIPTMLPDDRLSLVNAVLQEVLTSHGLTLSDQDTKRMSQSWGACLDRYINQPRAAKRLFTQVDATWGDVAGEVDFVDFVLMTFIRTFEPSIYDLVEEHADELLSSAGGLWPFKPKETHPERWERWLGYVRKAGAQHPNAVGDLLAELFVPLRSAKNNMEYGSASKADIANRKGVGHPDYFYRYTQTGVPRNDIAESTILECLRELRDSRPGGAVAAVETKLVQDAPLVVSKIMRHGVGSNLPVAGLMRLLGRNYEAIGTNETGFLAHRPSRAALDLAQHLISSVPEEAISIVRTTCETPSGLTLISDLLRQQLRHTSDGERQAAWIQEAGLHVAQQIASQLESLDEAPDTDFERAFRNIYALRDLTSESHVRDILWGLIRSRRRWDVVDVLAAMLPLGYGSDGDNEWRRVGDLEAETVDSILGIENVADLLGESLTSASVDEFDPRFDHSPTLSERKPFAVASFIRILRSFRQQQE
ncbi:P-loop NTPase fold protein [Arthrobacter sp. ES3-54]|uniref:KAP family P-loop NTPase fold protein n=1 Tax=Arthrobacter sp. ES3-54 TaxID=1502991 RepID=UPI00240504FC|nr:P-loop NTPase fold protein [Arthrobacter sp. ES3-54]MDF9752816.1 energy-coupling factor transporter ATP-binding protein EcfA2 [Arthrobacter sp. ES3-54]